MGLSLGVGLGNSGAGQEYEWVSCGSENNRLFTYHTSVAKPISSVHFAGSVNPVTVCLFSLLSFADDGGGEE